jgi:DNA mismatch endonuclease (patch repair protein)
VMPDIFTKAKRSAVMSAIRGRENKDTELRMAALFRGQRIGGWHRHQPIFGKPDFIFPVIRLAVFIDDCFWRGYPKNATKPKNNAGFWRRKLATNKARDHLVTHTLRAKGWSVPRIREHELPRKNEVRLVRRIRGAFV